MSIIVENGTGLSTAESYISVVEADTYHSVRGNTLWATMSVNEREQALRRATDYMGQVYRLQWQGRRINSTQALDFPRYDVVVDGYYIPSNVLPLEIKNANAELAFKAAGGELYADQSQGVISEQVGPIKVEYNPNSPATIRYKAIDALLLAYFDGAMSSGINLKAVRS
jgi:hypothetical protein